MYTILFSVRSSCSDGSLLEGTPEATISFTTIGSNCAAQSAGIVGDCLSPDEESPIFVNCPSDYVW
ncbi:MAG: hypothetical protein IPO26_19430 [Saprospiraceae bacterium]|nr:hypothetical protein [Saprospiraceae bacterium]